MAVVPQIPCIASQMIRKPKTPISRPCARYLLDYKWGGGAYTVRKPSQQKVGGGTVAFGKKSGMFQGT